MIENKCFITYQFKTGGVEKIFINISSQYKGTIYLINIYPHIDEYVNFIPDNVKLIKIPRLLNKIHIKFLQYIFCIIYLLYITKSKKEYRKLSFINFSDTLSTLFATWILSIGNRNKYSWIHLNPRVLSKSKFYKVYSFLYQKMDKIICICNDQKELFHKIFPNISPKATTVIFNGIIPEQINALKTIPLGTNYLNEKYILMVARLDMRSKDFFTVIDAYTQDKYISGKYKLYFLGEGPDRASIEEYINSKGLTNNIVLLGQDINPYRWMYNAELYIHSSKSEGFGLVIIEAMQCGVPVIATDCEVGPREILNKEEFGITIPICDSKAMSIAISTILYNDKNKEYYRKQSSERAKNYHINKSIKKIEAL